MRWRRNSDSNIQALRRAVTTSPSDAESLERLVAALQRARMPYFCEALALYHLGVGAVDDLIVPLEIRLDQMGLYDLGNPENRAYFSGYSPAITSEPLVLDVDDPLYLRYIADYPPPFRLVPPGYQETRIGQENILVQSNYDVNFWEQLDEIGINDPDYPEYFSRFSVNSRPGQANELRTAWGISFPQLEHLPQGRSIFFSINFPSVRLPVGVEIYLWQGYHSVIVVPPHYLPNSVRQSFERLAEDCGMMLFDRAQFDEWLSSQASSQQHRRNPDGYIDDFRYTSRGSGKLKDYYPESADGSYEEKFSLYRGRNVIWDGEEGKMIKINPEYVIPTFGNVWDSDKLSAVVRGVQQSEDYTTFEAAYGDVDKIDLQTVKESIEYEEEQYRLTTGDEELDRYLVDPEEVLEEYADREEEPEEYLEAKNDLDERLKEAENNNEGDLGEWQFTLRDGNHRIFGAILAGEPYIYGMITTNKLRDAQKADTPELIELLEKLE